MIHSLSLCSGAKHVTMAHTTPSTATHEGTPTGKTAETGYDDETDVEEEGKEEGEDGEGRVTDPSPNVAPTLAYDMDTDAEVEGNKAGSNTDPTLAYEVDTDTEMEEEPERREDGGKTGKRGAGLTGDRGGATAERTGGRGGGAKEEELSDPTLPYDSPPVGVGNGTAEAPPPAAALAEEDAGKCEEKQLNAVRPCEAETQG